MGNKIKTGPLSAASGVIHHGGGSGGREGGKGGDREAGWKGDGEGKDREKLKEGGREERWNVVKEQGKEKNER